MRRLAKHTLVEKLSEERKQEMQRDIGIASNTLDLIMEIIDRRIAQLDAGLMNKDVYNMPAYAYMVADHSGAKRELMAIKKLLDHSEADNG